MSRGKAVSMKRLHLVVLLLAVLSGLALHPVCAEDKPGPKPVAVKTLLDYRAELNLSAQQVEAVTKTLLTYQEVVAKQRLVHSTHQKEYSALVAGRAPLEEIKVKLRQMTEASFDLRWTDVVTAREVESALSAQQLAAWRDIQAKVRQKTP